MNKNIKAGMYRGITEAKQISLDPKYIKIKTEDGSYVEVPSPSYVRDVETQILELTKRVAIQEGVNSTQDRVMRMLQAAIKKVDARFR
jgi:hypothetical protein